MAKFKEEELKELLDVLKPFAKQDKKYKTHLGSIHAAEGDISELREAVIDLAGDAYKDAWRSENEEAYRNLQVKAEELVNKLSVERGLSSKKQSIGSATTHSGGVSNGVGLKKERSSVGAEGSDSNMRYQRQLAPEFLAPEQPMQQQNGSLLLTSLFGTSGTQVNHSTSSRQQPGLSRLGLGNDYDDESPAPAPNQQATLLSKSLLRTSATQINHSTSSRQQLGLSRLELGNTYGPPAPPPNQQATLLSTSLFGGLARKYHTPPRERPGQSNDFDEDLAPAPRQQQKVTLRAASFLNSATQADHSTSFQQRGGGDDFSSEDEGHDVRQTRALSFASQIKRQTVVSSHVSALRNTSSSYSVEEVVTAVKELYHQKAGDVEGKLKNILNGRDEVQDTHIRQALMQGLGITGQYTVQQAVKNITDAIGKARGSEMSV